MINRQVKKTTLSPGRVRYRVVVTGESCQPHTHEARVHQSIFLSWIADNQPLLQCGYSIPDRILVHHNGECWQAEAEAEVDEEIED